MNVCKLTFFQFTNLIYNTFLPLFLIVAVVAFYSSTAFADKQRAEELLKSGNDLFAKGKYSEAIRNYTEGTYEDPSVPDLYFNRAAAYYKLDQYQNAINDYSKVAAVSPNYKNLFYFRGISYLKLNDTESALSDFYKADSLNQFKENKPANAMLNYYLGSALVLQKDYGQAIMYLKKSNLLNPKYMDTYQKLSDAYVGTGNFQNAADTLSKALELDPNNDTISKSMAKMLLLSGRYNDAIRTLNATIENNPDNVEAQLLKAKALMEKQDYNASLQTMKEIGQEINKAPSNDSNNASSGSAPMMSLPATEGNNAPPSTKVPAIPQNGSNSANAGASASAKANDPTAGMQYDPGDSQGNYLNAFINYKAGNYDQSVDILTKMILADKQNTTLYRLRAQNYIKLHQKDKACGDAFVMCAFGVCDVREYLVQAKYCTEDL